MGSIRRAARSTSTASSRRPRAEHLAAGPQGISVVGLELDGPVQHLQGLGVPLQQAQRLTQLELRPGQRGVDPQGRASASTTSSRRPRAWSTWPRVPRA